MIDALRYFIKNYVFIVIFLQKYNYKINCQTHINEIVGY